MINVLITGIPDKHKETIKTVTTTLISVVTKTPEEEINVNFEFGNIRDPQLVITGVPQEHIERLKEKVDTILVSFKGNSKVS